MNKTRVLKRQRRHIHLKGQLDKAVKWLTETFKEPITEYELTQSEEFGKLLQESGGVAAAAVALVRYTDTSVKS